jgi:regulatory protein
MGWQIDNERGQDQDPSPRSPVGPSGGRDRRRRSKGMSENSLYQAALFYLGRYAASSWSVRQVLQRRVTKYAAIDGVEKETATGWIDGIIDRLMRSGLVHDGDFAMGRALTLFRRGLSKRMIRLKLAEKGLDREVIESALDVLMADHRDPDLEAACRFAQRRRLGPYRPPEVREAHWKRDLAILARAGFSYGVARMVIEAGDVDDLAALDRGR